MSVFYRLSPLGLLPLIMRGWSAEEWGVGRNGAQELIRETSNIWGVVNKLDKVSN